MLSAVVVADQLHPATKSAAYDAALPQCGSQRRYPGLGGWPHDGMGQDGALASTAGHHSNYIALKGALHVMGRAGERPVLPFNLVGNYCGGAMFLRFGVV
jgi:crotonobetainyl-CoA:carnitine CoA-transferase CaiB-like acyl-CoA transferase